MRFRFVASTVGLAVQVLSIALLSFACAHSNGDTGFEDPRKVFEAERAWRHLEALVAIGPRPAGSPGAEQARRYIENQLTANGLRPEREAFTAKTPVGEIAMCNVYADLSNVEGSEADAPIVLLVSHYDTKRIDGFVGANDGGSSTALLLELARALALTGGRRTTYRFLFVDGEEALRETWIDPDNCYGSRHHAEQLVRAPARERFKAAVVIDMIGDKDLALIEDLASSPNLLQCFFDAARQNGLAQHVGKVREAVADDHKSFKAIGIPACVLIDLRFGPDGGNGYWHTREDTLDKCSVGSLEIAGTIVLAGLPKLDQLLHKR